MAQPFPEGAVKFSIPPNQVGKRIMWSLVPDFFHANELCLNVFMGLGDREHGAGQQEQGSRQQKMKPIACHQHQQDL